ncbi:Fic family protein [Phytohabitans rumicis]|uniref:Cell division protein Fic n=1 Tax=Phytohabitans rumicis TaxID=1076125 RepID=A0A6V8LEN4_9ACTN|nr:Fic family protein [Phytohabitans rumicis]GFJ95702.1 cell division protein Fic [Phytohabitans rumicis]
MLFQVPKLDANDARVLAEIEACYEDLRQATDGDPAKHRWEGHLRQQLVAGAVQGSNSIESYKVSLDTATAIVADGPVPADVPDETREAVAGYRDALSWVLQTPAMEYFTHHEMVLSALHFMMLRSRPAQWPGRYRDGGIMVAGDDPMNPAYVGPDPDQVRPLMVELVDWLNDGDPDAPPLVRAAMAHVNLVRIHPWRDGNGRMSRCLQTLVLARAGVLAAEFCSIEEWLGRELNTLHYYAELRKTGGTYDATRDAHDWVRFNLRAHHQQAHLVRLRLERARRTWEDLTALVKRLGLPERTVSALHTGTLGRLRREAYQQDEGLSRDQAIRDIRRLEAEGLLDSYGYGVTLYYVAAGRARDVDDAVVDDLRTPATEPYRT